MRNHDPRGAQPPVYRITAAQPSVKEDVAGRQKRYLVSMGIRTGCFLLAVAASGWLRWVLFAAAILLPYFSVVFANAGREREKQMPVLVHDSGRPALDSAPPRQRRAP